MGGVLATIRTPAQAPKLRRKLPGWPRGQSQKRRERYPVVKKGPEAEEKGRLTVCIHLEEGFGLKLGYAGLFTLF